MNNNIDNLDKVVEKKVIFNSKKDKTSKKGIKAQKIDDDFDFDNLVIGNDTTSQQEQQQPQMKEGSSSAYDFKPYGEE